jgi:hypothetical protein
MRLHLRSSYTDFTCLSVIVKFVYRRPWQCFLVAQELATIILLQALRLHLSERLKSCVGWLFTLADRQMSAAMSVMHTDPTHRWFLQTIAKRAGTSRTIFTLRLKKTVAGGLRPNDLSKPAKCCG